MMPVTDTNAINSVCVVPRSTGSKNTVTIYFFYLIGVYRGFFNNCYLKRFVTVHGKRYTILQRSASVVKINVIVFSIYGLNSHGY